MKQVWHNFGNCCVGVIDMWVLIILVSTFVKFEMLIFKNIFKIIYTIFRYLLPFSSPLPPRPPSFDKMQCFSF